MLYLSSLWRNLVLLQTVMSAVCMTMTLMRYVALFEFTVILKVSLASTRVVCCIS